MQRSTKKIMAAVGALAVGSVALTGCGGPDAPEAPTEGEIAGEIVYSYWGTPARAEKVGVVTDMFTDANPGATVKGEIAEYTAYFERMTVRAAGDDLACATGMQGTQLGVYAESGAFLDLAPLIESGQIDVSDIPEATLEAGQVDGVQYMIPTGNFVLTMGYNEAAVAEAGGEPLTDDLTWEDYAEWAKALQPGLPEGVYATENQGSMISSFQTYVASQGLDFYGDAGLGFDEQVLADWFTYWLDLIDAGATIPASMIPEQHLAMELQPFAQGKAVSGIRDIANLLVTENALVGIGQDTEVVQVSIPSGDAESPSNLQGSNGIAIPGSCTNVATAAAFVDYFTNDIEAGLSFGASNGTVTNVAVQDAFLDSAETPGEVKEIITIFRELTDAGDILNLPAPAGSASLTAEFRRLFEAVAFGDRTVDAAVSQFFAAAERALD